MSEGGGEAGKRPKTLRRGGKTKGEGKGGSIESTGEGLTQK